MPFSKADAEPTATDERIAENQEPAPIAPATRKEAEAEAGGLPPGIRDNSRSPLDPVFSDPKGAGPPTDGPPEAS